MRIILWTGRHSRIGWVLALVLVAWWATDREPPFAITGPVVVKNAQAGQQFSFVAPVRRDIERDCDVSWTRFIVDGLGVRHDFLEKTRSMSADGIRNLQSDMGPYLRLSVPIPQGAAPGRASYQNALEYVCNPTHWLVPIRVHMRIDFEVLP